MISGNEVAGNHFISMKKIVVFIACLFLSQVKAQIDPVKYPTYTNIEDALKSDQTVYSISFRKRIIQPASRNFKTEILILFEYYGKQA